MKFYLHELSTLQVSCCSTLIEAQIYKSILKSKAIVNAKQKLHENLYLLRICLSDLIVLPIKVPTSDLIVTLTPKLLVCSIMKIINLNKYGNKLYEILPL